jgi:hypothetical protein
MTYLKLPDDLKKYEEIVMYISAIQGTLNTVYEKLAEINSYVNNIRDLMSGRDVW